MITRLRARIVASDDGFGLAELGIYAALSVVILTIVATLFISALNIRTQVADLTTAAGIGQLIASSVEEGARNASGPPGATDPNQVNGIYTAGITSRGQLLRARVAVGAQDGSIVWQCQAWYFSLDTSAVYSATDANAMIEDPVGFTKAGGVHTADAGGASWTLLGEGVHLTPDDLVFVGANAGKVTLKFEVTTADERLILIPSTVVQRSLAAGGLGPETCY